ncbi:hypothetical protein D3C72_2581740 [compost metagenome]
MRRDWPSLVGVRPRSLLRMARSMAVRAARSKGWIASVRASGVETEAMALMAVMEP